MIPFGNGKRLGAGGGIRHRRAAGDHIQRVPQNVAQHDAEHLRRGTALREPPALHTGKPLADGIHLHNVGPAGQQLARDVLQLCPGNERLLEQRTAAAGKQEQHCIPGGQPLHQLQRLLGGRKTVCIRHRVARLIAGHTWDLTFHMAVLGHDHAATHPAQRFNRRMCHLPGRLARRYQKHPALPGPEIPQRAAHRLIRQNSVQAGTKDHIRIPAQCNIHRLALLAAVPAPPGQRTRNSRIKNQDRRFLLKSSVLFQSEWRESNSRPLEPHSSALPKLRYTRTSD